MTAGEGGAAVRRGRRVVGLIGTGHFMAHFFTLTLPPLFPLIKDDLGVGYTELGLLLTAFAIASGLVQTPVGFVVDRVGARWVLIFGLGVESLAFVLMGLAGSYGALLLLVVITGLGNSVFHPADYAILSAAVDRGRLGRAFSLHTFSGYAGWAVAPAAMALMATAFGWQGALAGAGIAGLFVTGVLALHAAALAPAASTAAAPTSEPAPAATGPAAGARSGARSGALAVLISRPVLLCFLFYVFIAMANAGVKAFLVTALVGIHDVPLAWANTVLTAFYVGSAVGILLGGQVADRTTRHELVAMAGLAATAAAILIVGQWAFAVAVLTLIVGVAGLTQGLIMPSRDMLVRAVAPAGTVGSVFAFVSTGLDLGGAVTPAVFGWFLDRGSHHTVFWLTALTLMLAIGTVLAAKKSQGVASTIDYSHLKM